MGKISRERPWHQATHFLSFTATGIAAASELMRLIQEILARESLPASNSVDCPVYLRGTDLPTQPLGDVLAPVWHAINFTALVFLCACDAPGRYLNKRIARFWLGVGEYTGLWHQGALQFLIATGLVATPVNFYGTRVDQLFQLASGYCLWGMSIVNLFIGMAWQGDVRVARHQRKTEEEFEATPDPKDDVADAAHYLAMCIRGCHFLDPAHKKKIFSRLDKLETAASSL